MNSDNAPDFELLSELSTGKMPQLFAKALGRESRVLSETKSLLLLPTVSPLLTGHVLIFAKTSRRSFADLVRTDASVPQQLWRLVKEYESKFGKATMFEHGTSVNTEAACGVIRAHVHLVPQQSIDVEDVTRRLVSRLALLSSGVCTSCMDMTDGLGQSLKEISEASKVRIRIDVSALPMNPVVVKIAEFLKCKPEKIVFGIGLDLELLGTTSAKSAHLANGLFHFGEIVEGEPDVEVNYGPSLGPVPVSGWQHFTGSAMEKVQQMYAR